MKLSASGGTDGVTMVLFWPDNLPDDADRRLQDDPIDLIEKMDAEGKLIYFPCGGDGGYTLSVYVGEDLPAELAPFCKEHSTYASLAVRGDGYFGGGECMFKKDASFIAQYSHMAGKVAVPEGIYSASVYETHVPRAVNATWVRQRVGASADRLFELYQVLWGFIVGGVLATLIGLLAMTWAAWSLFAAGTLAVIAGAAALSRTAAYKNVVAAREAFTQAFPAYVVRLKA